MGSNDLALPSRSQRSHSHQGITGKFLCSQIKHPEIQVSLLENTFKGLFQLLNTPQTHHEDIKKGALGPGWLLLCSQGCAILWAELPQSPKLNLKWNTHQGGNRGIIDEKLIIHMGHSHPPPARHHQAAPPSVFLFAHLYEPGPACRQPSLREKDLYKTKNTATTSSTVIRRKEI